MKKNGSPWLAGALATTLLFGQSGTGLALQPTPIEDLTAPVTVTALTPGAAPAARGYLTGPMSGDALDIARAYLQAARPTYGFTATDLTDFAVTDRYTSAHNGLTHLYLVQRWQGIEVFNGIFNFNIDQAGRVLWVGNRWVPDLAGTVNTTRPTLTALQAVERAAAFNGLALTTPLTALDFATRADQGTLLSDGGISQNAIPAQLVYDTSGKTPRLAWNVSIYTRDSAHWWQTRVDAVTGQILSQNDWVVHDHWGEIPAGTAPAAQPVARHPLARHPLAPTLPITPVTDGSSYQVYAWPVESPSHATPPSPADGRTTVAEPADTLGSPYGWHDINGAAGAEFTTTQGNNVHAYTDVDFDDTPDAGSSPDGGASLDFVFALDLTQAPSTYRPAAVANLFYWNNLMHDIPYRYGFDEAAGSFQENNYGRGGLGSDAVNAEAQDGGGMNNANFATPADGGNPRMQMYLWDATNPHRDGDLDNGIIAHEYGHGISNRLTGGPSQAGCLSNAEQMGEGWSDWQTLFMTMSASENFATGRGIGTYALGQAPTGVGIRPAKYSTNFAVNNYTYANITTLGVPHGVGFVWNTMLYEMTAALVAQHGLNPDLYGAWHTGGNNLAYQLVTDGMKIQPCAPGFVDGRDAILAADVALTGGVNYCTIWKAFAKRGLGYSASQGSSNSRSDGTQAFDQPPGCLFLSTPAPQNICQNQTASYLLFVGELYTTPVTLSVTGNPAPSTATFTPNPVMTVPSTTTLTISNTGSVPGGTYTMQIQGNNLLTATASATLTVYAGAPIAPVLTSPAHNATAVALKPTFTWAASANTLGYALEVATDMAFTNVVYTANLTGTSRTLTNALAGLTTYYWRVRGENSCGFGPNAAVFSFTTAISPGSCPVGQAPTTVFSDTMESGAGGWTHSGPGDTWAQWSTRVHSGAMAWHATDSETESDQRLTSPAIGLPTDSLSLTLQFWNYQAFEAPDNDGRCWDAGILEVSTNGGASWSKMPNSALLSDPYDAVIWNDQAGNNPITDDYGATEAWCPNPPPQNWLNSVVDLSAYAGQTVNFRFRLGTDGAAGNEGWSIDDVVVQSCVAAVAPAYAVYGPFINR